LGLGVDVEEACNLANRLLEVQLAAENSNLARDQIEESTLTRIEAIFNDVNGTGISQALSDFFGAMNDVKDNPEGLVERNVLLERARVLSQRISSSDTQLKQIRKDLNAEVKAAIGEINDLTKKIADLNRQIQAVESRGASACDLRDQQSQLVKELSGKVDVNVFEDANGQLTVSMGNVPLVFGDKALVLKGVPNLANDGFVDVVVDTGNGSSVSVFASALSGGKLKGLLDLRDQRLPEVVGQLDQLAAGLTETYNDQHKKGFGLDGVGDRNFFSPLLSPEIISVVTPGAVNTGSGEVSVITDSLTGITGIGSDTYEVTFDTITSFIVRNLRTGTTSTLTQGDMFEGVIFTFTGTPAVGDQFEITLKAPARVAEKFALDLSITSDKIAAALTLAGLPGDNGNAVELVRLQDKKIGVLGVETVSDFYANFVSDIGAQVQSAKSNLAAQENITEQLNNLNDAASGVSLDEEMANLLQFQRAYDAAAQLVRAADDMFLTVLDMARTR